LENDLFNKAHQHFHNGDFSASIKNAVLYGENTSENNKSDIDSFLSNLFINIGDFVQAKILLSSIVDEGSNNKELNGHILKLQGHLFFNKEMWSKANEFYDKSLKIFIKEKSKYVNEVIFYKIMIDIINEEREISIKDRVNDIFIEDSYFELINIMENYYNNKKKYDQDIDINRIEKLENNRYKAYGAWLVSKIMSQLNKMDRAYEFETQAQQFIKLSSEDISDEYLRSKYLEEIFIHKIIMTETSISVDNLFDLDEDINDEFKGLINFSTFHFCVNCGSENNKKDQKCSECETVLIKEYYEKN
jgi:tetratricopeptide (TPR) repeat protein